jgi:SAM-dependent methyltransferase
VGSNLDRYLCGKCYCNDRDRHLWLYLTAAGFSQQISGQKILHLAPEVHIERRLKALSPIEYIAGDLHPRDPLHTKVDCERMQFADNYFDLIICNHVLEHVSDARRALSELARCLKPDGFLIAQTPYVPGLKYTFELEAVPSEALCRFLYGQEDHVRLFGKDIVDLFRAAGFNGNLFPHSSVLPNIDAVEYGCNEHEPFFLFAKNPCQQYPF